MVSRWNKFSELSRVAAECRLCIRMKDCRAVLGATNGPLDAKIVFVAEAPGRFGAGKTQIPLQGDRSGDNFESLIAATGLSRGEVFITNAVLCLPLKNGNNSQPSTTEIKNCSTFLKSTLNLIKPRVIVSLGAVALAALNKVYQTRFKLNEKATIPQKLPNSTLLPLYHPSPRVIHTRRSIFQQKMDFKKILTLLKIL